MIKLSKHYLAYRIGARFAFNKLAGWPGYDNSNLYDDFPSEYTEPPTFMDRMGINRSHLKNVNEMDLANYSPFGVTAAPAAKVAPTFDYNPADDMPLTMASNKAIPARLLGPEDLVGDMPLTMASKSTRDNIADAATSTLTESKGLGRYVAPALISSALLYGGKKFYDYRKAKKQEELAARQAMFPGNPAYDFVSQPAAEYSAPQQIPQQAIGDPDAFNRLAQKYGPAAAATLLTTAAAYGGYRAFSDSGDTNTRRRSRV
jgi:hypothetical protein